VSIFLRYDAVSLGDELITQGWGIISHKNKYFLYQLYNFILVLIQ